MKSTIFLTILLLSASFSPSEAGLFSYAICQTGCNALAVACYAGAGYIFGTVTAGVGVAPAIIGCNTGLGVCMTACVAAGCLPIP